MNTTERATVAAPSQLGATLTQFSAADTRDTKAPSWRVPSRARCRKSTITVRSRFYLLIPPPAPSSPFPVLFRSPSMLNGGVHSAAFPDLGKANRPALAVLVQCHLFDATESDALNARKNVSPDPQSGTTFQRRVKTGLSSSVAVFK